VVSRAETREGLGVVANHDIYSPLDTLGIAPHITPPLSSRGLDVFGQGGSPTLIGWKAGNTSHGWTRTRRWRRPTFAPL
jgi:hypothetical protein